MSCIRSTVSIQSVVGITVVSNNNSLIIFGFSSFYNFFNALVNSYNSFFDSRVNSGVTNHIVPGF